MAKGVTSMKYSNEELNFFRVCKVTAGIINEKLRIVFKREWDTRYKVTHGQWQDTAKNGSDFCSMESKRNRIRNAKLLHEMIKGNTKDWDCTSLCYAILYSDSIGPGLNFRVRQSVDELRKFRNAEESFHNPDGKIAKADFKTAINKVISALQALKFDTALIEEIRDQTSFPTEELEETKKELEKEKKRNEEPRPFCVLPPKPSHNSINRLREVEEINKEMKRLMNTKKNEVTVVYLSGNPGCGKSELARQVGEGFFSEKQATNCVMTLTASSIDTMLQSYLEFARKVGCDEDSVTRITTSEDRSQEEKLNDLIRLMSPRLQGYSKWLMILDNVLDLKSVSKFWPQAGDKTTGIGQILVTTQDSSSIPYDSAYTYHKSLKQGMDPADAIKVLRDISGLPCEDDNSHVVAEALNFQPLALACAAVYMKCARISDWTIFQQKLEKGKREATEKQYQKTSLAYPRTMTEASRMAVEKVANEDDVMRHAFQFLSVIAPEPISLTHVVEYVTNCLPNEDEKVVASSVCSSSLVLLSEENESKEIRVHQVVYDCLQTVEFAIDHDVIFEAVSAFMPLILEDVFDKKMIVTRRLVAHFSSISTRLQHIVEQDPTASVISASRNIFKVIASLLKMVDICGDRSKHEDFKFFFEIVLKNQKTKFYDNCLAISDTLKLLQNAFEELGLNQDAKWCNDKALVIDRAMTVLYSKCQEEDTSDTARGIASAVTDQNVPEDGDDEEDKLIKLGKNLLPQGKFREAKTSFERALERQESIYDDNHPLVADSLKLIGKTLCFMQNYKEAKSYFERALSIQKRIHDFVFTLLDSTHHFLAKYFWDKGRYPEAEIAMAVQEIKQIENHSSLELTLNDAGENFCSMGKYDDAKRCLEKALEIQVERYNETHVRLVDTLNILCNTLRNMGKYKESKKYIDRALEIQEKASLETQQSSYS